MFNFWQCSVLSEGINKFLRLFMVKQCYGVMVLWCYGVVVLWCYGEMVLFCYGIMAKW